MRQEIGGGAISNQRSAVSFGGGERRKKPPPLSGMLVLEETCEVLQKEHEITTAQHNLKPLF